MTRFVLRRLLIIPVALLLINFAGFSYAHVVRPLRAARTPFFFGPLPQPAPLFPAYADYLEGGFGLNDPMPQGIAGGQNVAQALGTACRASLGLFGLAAALSILLGLVLGMLAVRSRTGRVSRWLTFLSSAGLAMPSFYVGSLLILGSLAFVLWGRPGTHAPLPVQGFGWDLHLVIPALALMVRPTVEIAQMTAGLLVSC